MTPSPSEPIIPTEVRVVEPGRGPGYTTVSPLAVQIAEHLCRVWGWQPDDPEAVDLGLRAADALTRAIAGTRTSADSLIPALLSPPWDERPAAVYARALADVRAAIIAADPAIGEETLAIFDAPNPYERS